MRNALIAVLISQFILFAPPSYSQTGPEIVYSVEKWIDPEDGGPYLESSSVTGGIPGLGLKFLDHSSSFEGERSTHRVYYLVRAYSIH